jgi:hypothetical protein
MRNLPANGKQGPVPKKMSQNLLAYRSIRTYLSKKVYSPSREPVPLWIQLHVTPCALAKEPLFYFYSLFDFIPEIKVFKTVIVLPKVFV